MLITNELLIDIRQYVMRNCSNTAQTISYGHNVDYSRDLEEILQNTPNFETILNRLINATSLKTSTIYGRIDMTRQTFFNAVNINKNNNTKTSHNNIIKLCIALRLDLSDATLLLNSAGESFFFPRDFVVKYFIVNNLLDDDTTLTANYNNILTVINKLQYPSF